MMVNLTLALGAVLTLIGIVAYAASGAASVTALIPAFFGIPLLALGVLARQERWRMHAIHVAVVVALLGALGAARGLMSLPTLLTGGELERPAAVAVQSLMAALCIVYVVLAVKSFIDARRKPSAGPTA